jgi:hypothetical protein
VGPNDMAPSLAESWKEVTPTKEPLRA